MSQYLPHGWFKWLSDEQMNRLKIFEISDESYTRYILEQNLKVPIDLHAKFSDLPPCLEHRIPMGSKN